MARTAAAQLTGFGSEHELQLSGGTGASVPWMGIGICDRTTASFISLAPI